MGVLYGGWMLIRSCGCVKGEDWGDGWRRGG